MPQGMRRPLTDRSQEGGELTEEGAPGWIWKVLPEEGLVLGNQAQV